MENNAPCKVPGVGTIKIKILNRVLRALADVRHIPNLTKNSISLSTLDSKGYKYSSEGGALEVRKVVLVVIIWQKSFAHLYIL